MLREFVTRVDAEILTRESYLTDFGEVRAALDSDSLKLEVGQSFREPGFDSWRAFDAGDLVGSISFAEASRTRSKANYDSRRIRIVDDARLSPYLEWELMVLLRKSIDGEIVHILSSIEAEKQLGHDIPELLFIGPRVMWQPLYSPDGTNVGGMRYEDDALVPEIHQMIMAIDSSTVPIDVWMRDNRQRFELDWPSDAFAPL
jgi:hypothetical protein